MKRKSLLSLTAFALLSLGVGASAQTAAQAPSAPSTPSAPSASVAPRAPFGALFFDGDNFLGVRVEDLTRENASRYQISGEPRGVGVKEVVKGSPADKAGVRAGDVITRFDGEAVTSVRKLTRLIEESAPEHVARVVVLRNGSEQELSATLAERERFSTAGEGDWIPGFDAESLRRMGEEMRERAGEWQLKGDEMRKRLEELQRANPGGVFVLGSSRRIGVSTSTLSRQLADYFGVSNGVLVNSVEAGSPADKAGLKAGDIIMEADGKKIEDVGDLVAALGGKDEGDVTLTVMRDRKQRTVRVTPERRRGQGRRLTPGAFVLNAPVTTVTLPRVFATPRAPLAPSVRVVVPRPPVAPRAVTIPRVRVKPSRVHIINWGEAVL